MFYFHPRSSDAGSGLQYGSSVITIILLMETSSRASDNFVKTWLANIFIRIDARNVDSEGLGFVLISLFQWYSHEVT